MLESHLIGSSRYDDNTGILTDGKLQYTAESIRNYYYSDSASLMLSTYISEGASFTPREYAETVRLEIIDEARYGTEAVKILMINNTNDSVDSILIKGKSGKTRLCKNLGYISLCSFSGNTLNINSGSENILRFKLGKLYRTLNERAFLFVDSTLLLSFLHDSEKLFFCDGSVVL